MQTTIIIPCFNEENRLNINTFVEFSKFHPDIQFLFVNDGSTDGTLSILQQLSDAYPKIYYLDIQPNCGKAEAVRKGMMYAVQNYDSEFIGFWDADLATPLTEIPIFIDTMQKGEYDIVTGMRIARLGANIERKNTRHLLGRCFATTASLLLDIPVYDTQCGSKMYRRNIIQQLFDQPFISKWLFDVEILARYIHFFNKENAKKNICEQPLLSWGEINGSRLKVKDFINAPFELIKIKKQYK